TKICLFHGTRLPHLLKSKNMPDILLRDCPTPVFWKKRKALPAMAGRAFLLMGREAFGGGDIADARDGSPTKR
ncbi:hypothetical protein, partial [uncultured Desulfovibrio sp.]|uniref:hypothetical protein n=1 Tax=uncultured Desulfovibrio sp. TaxID=167968 RepID=UPI0026086EFD